MLKDIKILKDIKTLRFRLPLRFGSVNCYLIQTDKGHFLVDTGGSRNRKDLLAQLQRAGCQPGSLRIVILTHGDFDHIGNAAFLRTAYKTKLAMHDDDRGMSELGDMFANRAKPNILIRTLLPLFFGFSNSERFVADVNLQDDLDLSQYGLPAKVIHIPGHSLGSVGILTTDGDFFCGDLFENTKSPGLNTIMDNPEAANVSFAKLRALNIRTVYPGHGQPFAMEELPN